MTKLTFFVQMALLGWFFGCICTYKVRNVILVEGEGVKSPEFVMLCLFTAGIASFWIFPFWGNWFLLGVLILWAAAQFFSHWYYTIFGTSEAKLKGYNECFQNTLHLIPASETRLIPDLYHMILHLLILLNIVFVICNM